jgi:pimeloyl-ACP methyl ester carboxylesterase
VNAVRVVRALRRLAVWAVRLVVALIVISAAGAAAEEIVSRRDAARFVAPGRLVPIGGRKLHVQCAGNGSPTVVFQAGGTGDSSEYTGLLPAIAEHTRACAYDRAGMGFSDPSDAPATASALTNDLEALLASARVAPPYVLVSSSGGGMTTELFARRHPDDVSGVVMLDAISGNMIDAMPEAASRLARRGCMARALSRVGLLRLLDPYHLKREGGARDEQAFAFSYGHTTWTAVCSLLSAGPVSADELRAAPPLRADLPLVVIRHERLGDLTKGGLEEDRAVEPIWQREQARLAARSSRGELVVATGSGHHIRDERPDLVIDAIVRIVNGARASR